MDRNSIEDIAAVTIPGVALRKESVDRNDGFVGTGGSLDRSLSARRAWIEIYPFIPQNMPGMAVALRKESVDRNIPPGRGITLYYRRSPQGERG